VRKIIPVVAAGATALALAGTTFGYANLNKDVTLSIDGQTTDVNDRKHCGRIAQTEVSRPTATRRSGAEHNDQVKTARGLPPVRPPGHLHH
jgi:hypothetical protein